VLVLHNKNVALKPYFITLTFKRMKKLSSEFILKLILFVLCLVKIADSYQNHRYTEQVVNQQTTSLNYDVNNTKKEVKAFSYLRK
jgi:hypothetical protein